MTSIPIAASPAITRLGLLLFGGGVLVLDAMLWPYALERAYNPSWFGVDFQLYAAAATNWASSGQWFWPYQLDGPYSVWKSEPMPILYPPTTIPLFLTFTILPAALWWIIPIGVTAAITARHRPPWQAWPLLVGLAAFPDSVQVFWTGNPTLWVMLAVALATVWPFFGSFSLLKVTMAPFALLGIRRRSWWLGLAALVAASVPFALLWADYVVVLGNADGHRGLLYSVTNWPLALIPVVAWLGGKVDREVVLDDRRGRQRAPVAHHGELQP